MLHRAIVASDKGVIQGIGLVATELIRRGEIVWRLDAHCRRLSCAEVEALPEAEREAFRLVAFQCDVDQFAVCDDIDRYMNHSCDPNTWWGDAESLIARKDIAPGGEVTCDYPTFEISVPFSMTCRCGAPRCRAVVTNLDYLDESWQEQYGRHVPGYVLRTIERTVGQRSPVDLQPTGRERA